VSEDSTTPRSLKSSYSLILGVVATVLALASLIFSYQSHQDFVNFVEATSPEVDGYVAPRNVDALIETVQNSTLTVECDYSGEEVDFGSGWVIDSSLLQIDSAKTTIVTNHHVIENCSKNRGSITIAQLGEKKHDAVLILEDRKNDLAILETELELDALELSINPPWSGYWVMALGSADGYEGSVAFGNVLNTTYEDILVTNNISGGNSGGPLVDNEGKVVGIVTWGMDYEDAQYNGARILDVFCKKVLECSYSYEGDPTWFDYSE
jgi:S1-C subfamily serine protease